MKKGELLSKSIVTLAIMTVLINPVGFAYGANCDPSWPVPCNPLAAGSLRDVVIVLIKFLISVIGIISFVFIVYSGVKYIISSGKEEDITVAKNTFTAAITGLLLAFMAFAIILAIEEILGVRSGG